MKRFQPSDRLYNIIVLVMLVLAALVVGGVVVLLLGLGAASPDGAASPAPADPPTLGGPSLPASWTPAASLTGLPTVTPPATLTTTLTPGPSVTPVPTYTATASITPTRPPDSNVNLDQTPLGLILEAGGLSGPTALADAGDVAGRLYVLEKQGTIRIVQDGRVLPVPFLNINSKVSQHDSEDGLLGLAFHPDYTINGIFYIYYTNRSDQSILARYSVSGNPDVADPGSEIVLLRLGQPTPEHNAGNLLFGPDGYLYVTLGDGGGRGDEYNNAQNGATLLGSILRLDVDSGPTYSIPPDNPFLGDPGMRDEIWAYGLRNPWGTSIDRLTGDMYFTDTGEVAFEEINFQPAGRGGRNYGWPLAQGRHCYPDKDRLCNPSGTTQPVLEVPHTSEICSLIGGYVYRGQQWPVLYGTYLYADFCYGTIYAMRRSESGIWESAQVTPTSLVISAFGEDRDGELFVLDFDRGGLYRVVAGL